MRELLPPLKADQADQIMNAVLNNHRQNIISIIQANDNAMIVGNIVKKAKLTQSRVSFHLKVLRNARLAIARRDGQRVYYELDHHYISQINTICTKLVVDSDFAIQRQINK